MAEVETRETVWSLEYTKDHIHAGLPDDLPKSNAKLPPSVQKAMELELKPLPSHLKYV